MYYLILNISKVNTGSVENKPKPQLSESTPPVRKWEENDSLTQQTGREI